MLALLEVVAGPDKGRAAAVGTGVKVILGRSTESKLHLTDPRVSRVHCHVEIGFGAAKVVDAGGSGGTYVNDVLVQQCDLNTGDTIRIGDSHIQFAWSDLDSKATNPYLAID